MRSQLAATPLTEFAYLQVPQGWDTDTPPQFMPETFAPVLDNFIPRNGKLTIRQPFFALFTGNANGDWNATTSPVNIRGWAPMSDGKVVLAAPTQFSASAGPQWTNDEGLWASLYGIGALVPSYGAGAAGDNCWHVTTWDPAEPQTGFVASIGAGFYAPGRSSTKLFGNTYYVSLPTSTAGLTGAGTGVTCGNCHLHVNQVQGGMGITNISAASGTPKACTSVHAYQSRLWVLGGMLSNAAVTTYSPNALFFSNPQTPTSGAPASASAWADPVSGATNVVYVDPDSNNPALGLAAYNQRLLIFCLNTVYVLLGTTPANYSVQLLSSSVGCIDQRSIVESEEGVYFLSDNGLNVTTGTSVVNVSANVQQSLSAAVQAYRAAVVVGRSGDCTAARLKNGDIIITIRTCDVRDTRISGFTTIWSGVYSPTTRTWYRVTSYLFAQNDSNPTLSNFSQDAQPAALVKAPGGVLSIGNRRAVVLESPQGIAMASTEFANTSSAGVDMGQVTTQGNGDYYRIPARWLSTLVPLSAAGRFYTTGVSWFVDYLLEISADGPSVSPTFAASIVDVYYEELDALSLACAVVPQPPPIPGPFVGPYRSVLLPRYPSLQHAAKDFSNEMDHVMVLIEFSKDLAPAAALGFSLVRGELFGVGVEFQQGRLLKEVPATYYTDSGGVEQPRHG